MFAKVQNHSRSRIKSLLNLCSPLKDVSRRTVSTRLVNLDAGLMHFVKCGNFPAKAYSCFLEAVSFCIHSVHSLIISSSLSLGTVTDIVSVSTQNPNQTACLAGLCIYLMLAINPVL